MQGKKCVCASCVVEAECHDNGWSLFDQSNKRCPNYKSGMREWKKFLKEYLYGKYDC